MNHSTTWAASLAGALLALVGCRAEPSGGVAAGGGLVPSATGAACLTPAEGCACDAEGASAGCGRVERQSGSYVTCSLGQTQCAGGRWGACIGDRIATRTLLGDQGLHAAGLGVPAPCVGNPCDPSCMMSTDDGNDLDAGANFLTGEAGLAINPVLQSEAGVACSGLLVTPAAQTITVTGLSPITTSPATPTFVAAFTPAACTNQSPPAAWDVDARDRVGISGGQLTFVSAVAGPLAVTAYSAGYSGVANATVVVDVTDTSAAPAGTAGSFVGGGTQADTMRVLFPYSGTVFPRAVAAPLLQWSTGGTAASAVKVTLRYPATGTPTFSVAAIIAESNPPRFQIPQDAWGYLDQTAAGKDAVIVVQRLAGALRNETTIPIHFATQPLRGNIFYTEYNVPNWTGDIKTAKPFGTKQSVSAYGAGAGCVPCHSVAAGGSTIVTSNWGSSNTSVGTVNANGTVNRVAGSPNGDGTDSRGFAYSAITPDGTLALQGSNWWGNTLDGVPTGTTRPHNNGSGLTGAYYTASDLSGAAACSRNDTTIDFAWGAAAPAPCIGANATYSVQWDGFLQPIFSETYTFDLAASDGVRLWVDGALVVDKWVTQTPAATWTGTTALTAGKKVALKLQYKNVSKTAGVHLGWQSASQPHEIVATTQLYPKSPPSGSKGLLGTYYPSLDFTGAQTITRVDPQVSFDWSGTGPDPVIGHDNYDVEWTGQLTAPCTDTFQICTYNDDGARLWIGTTKVVDAWYDQGATFHCANVPLTSGQSYDVKMDFYQKYGGSVAGLYWGSSCQGWNPISSNYLTPFGDQGLGGYDVGFRKSGDRGTGSPYKIFKLSTTPGTSPFDVSSNVASNWGLGATAMLAPAFSPDGKLLVFVDGDTAGGSSWRQGLSLWSFDEATSTFSARRNVVNAVSSNLVIRWPTVESDSRSLLYQTNPTSADDTSYGGMMPSAYGSIPGRLWSVDSVDPVSHPPVALDTVNVGNGGWESNRSYQPTVVPTAIGGYRWAVFTSTRSYGNTLNTTGPSTTQLWVAALDDAVSGTVDRSHPPFWLPNQVVGDDSARIRNERAYWVLDACHPAIVGGPAQPPPPPPPVVWADQDIGGVSRAGAVTSSAGTFTVTASGDDIWNNADAFHFMSAPVTGDVRIVARVNGLSWTDYWAKAGVMIRDSLSAGAPHAFMMINAGGLSGMQWRSSASGGSAWTSGPQVGMPYWVRMTRVGSTITGDISPDGVTWTLVDTQTPSIGATARVGLAVTSHNNGSLTTGVFDSISVTVPTAADPRASAVCQDDADCCGAQTSPRTAACTLDVPVTSPPTRHCVVLSAPACTGLGGNCASDNECCGFPNNRCASGVCAPPPPLDYYSAVTYTRDYTASCPNSKWIVWRFFDWKDKTPGDSSIVFSAQGATTQAGLATATSAVIGTAKGAPNTTWVGADVGAALLPLGVVPWRTSFLRLTMAFNPTSDHLQSPVLTSWRQSYSCVDSE